MSASPTTCAYCGRVIDPERIGPLGDVAWFDAFGRGCPVLAAHVPAVPFATRRRLERAAVRRSSPPYVMPHRRR